MLILGVKRLFVFLWLLFLPTQLGLHFWPEWSHVMGLRVDYLSPVLYFGDILWILMIVFNLPSLRNFGKASRARLGKILNIQNILLFSYVLINIFVAENYWVAGVKWFRIFQWIITFKIILQSRTLFREMLMKVLPFWIIGEGLLATAQVINGGSLNGIFYWLGERRFSYASIGVAQISYFGEGLIRAYGTFSHPNSLAGFMLVALYLWIKTLPLPPPLTGRGFNLNKIIYWVVFFCGVLGIVLSGSRTVWGIGIALIIMNYELRITNWKKILGSIFIFGGLIALIFSLINANYRISDFIGGWDSDGMTKRGALMVASLKMVRDNPLFGVGANNFLVQLPDYQKNSGVFWLQPVHNIIFLVVTEYGFIGFALLFLFIIKLLGGHKGPPLHWILLGIILVTGMVDHYWLTLPQNIWLLCVVLSIQFPKNKFTISK